MIVNDINEYVSLNVLQNYCSMHGCNCEECKLRDLCDCMASSPESWSLVFEGEKDENEENNEIKEKIEGILLKYGRREFKYDENNVCMFYKHEEQEVAIANESIYQNQGTIYFDNYDLCKQAIEEAGEDNIKKYIFGVDSK